MNLLRVQQSFLIGLDSYTNQLQLSIDRASWPELRKYAISLRPFNEVLLSLRQNLKVDTSSKIGEGLPDSVFNVDLISKIRKIFRCKGYITIEEAEYIYQSIVELYRVIEQGTTVTDNERIALRMQMVHVGRLCQSCVNQRRYRHQVVEHYNQAETRKTYSINEIVGIPWPNSFITNN